MVDERNKTRYKRSKRSSEKLVVKPLYLVKAFCNGWNSSEQPVA
jgi:hypothetical protein